MQNTPETTGPIESTAVTVMAPNSSAGRDFLDPGRWQTMKVAAETFIRSGAMPASIKNAPQLMMVMQAGYEAGLQPIEAINSFYFVNGKLSMYGEMAISQVVRAGHKVEFPDCDATTATCKITRGDDGRTMKTTFTMKQAQDRKLDQGREGKKMPWVMHPENMLKFKAFHMTAKFIVPDALHGVPLKEELEETEPEKTEPAEAPKVVTSGPPPAETVKSLEETLAASKTAQEPPQVAEGSIPQNEAADVAGASPAPEAEPQKETEDEKYDRIINKELGGEKLTPAEKMFTSKYRAKLEKKSPETE